jgi:hypothetical protein
LGFLWLGDNGSLSWSKENLSGTSPAGGGDDPWSYLALEEDG